MDNLQQLLNATQHNDANKVQELLERGILVDGQDSSGNTALQYAAANGHNAIVQLLLDHGASVDLPNDYGWTPLMHAVQHGHISTVVILLNKKAKVNTRNKLGVQPLTVAAWNGSFSMVLILLEAGAILNTQSTEDNTMECELSPLMAASLQGQEKIVCTLLERGCLVDQTITATGHTALMMAACNGHTETVRMLVEHGADVNAIDICNRSALNIATMLNKYDIAAYLRSKAATEIFTDMKEQAELIDAIKDGDVSLLEKLLRMDSTYCNYHLNDGTTPLMYAATLGQTSIVDLLIKCGTKLDEQDSHGWTALMQAVINKKPAVVQSLIEAGADVNIQANNGYKALDFAYLLGESSNEVKKLLIERTDSTGAHIASSQEHVTKTRSSSSSRCTSKEPQRNTSFRNWLGEMSSNVFNRLQHTKSSRQSLPSSGSEMLSPSAADVFPSPTDSTESVQSDKSTHSTRLSLSLFPSLNQLPSSQKNFPSVVPPPLFNPLSEIKKGESFIKKGLRIVPDAKAKKILSPALYPVHLLKKQHILATLPQEGTAQNVVDNGVNYLQSTPKTLQKKWNAREEKCKSFQRFSGSFSDTLCESPDSTSTLESSSNLDKTLIPSKTESVSFRERQIQMARAENQNEEIGEPAESTKGLIGQPALWVFNLALNIGIRKFLFEDTVREKLLRLSSWRQSINFLESSFNFGKGLSDQIEALLRQLSLGHYIEKFKSQEIDMEVFHNLTDDDLQELGVHTLQTRQKLLAVINTHSATQK